MPSISKLRFHMIYTNTRLYTVNQDVIMETNGEL